MEHQYGYYFALEMSLLLTDELLGWRTVQDGLQS